MKAVTNIRAPMQRKHIEAAIVNAASMVDELNHIRREIYTHGLATRDNERKLREVVADLRNTTGLLERELIKEERRLHI